MAKKDTKAAATGSDMLPRLSAHPRARRQIREAKGYGGATGFVLVALLSLQADVTYFDAGVRALIAGVVCYVVAWAAAVAVWRHLARAEVALAEQRLREQLNA
jgi:hypothetical protein